MRVASHKRVTKIAKRIREPTKIATIQINYCYVISDSIVVNYCYIWVNYPQAPFAGSFTSLGNANIHVLLSAWDDFLGVPESWPQPQIHYRRQCTVLVTFSARSPCNHGCHGCNLKLWSVCPSQMDIQPHHNDRVWSGSDCGLLLLNQTRVRTHCWIDHCYHAGRVKDRFATAPAAIQSAARNGADHDDWICHDVPWRNVWCRPDLAHEDIESMSCFKFSTRPDLAAHLIKMKSEVSKYNQLVELIKPHAQRLVEKEKIKKGKKVQVNEDPFDIMTWWKANKHHLPSFTRILRAVLTHIPNSCAPEAVFSVLNDTFSSDQKKSKSDYMELAIVLQYNARGREKLMVRNRN